MKTPKTTNSLPCLAFLLATLAITPVVYPSQANSQASASSSSAGSQQAPVVSAVPAISTAISSSSSSSLSTRSISSGSPSTTTSVPLKTTLAATQHYQALRFFEDGYDSSFYPQSKEELDTKHLVIKILTIGDNFIKQSKYAHALSCCKRAYEEGQKYPHLYLETRVELINLELTLGMGLIKRNNYTAAASFLEHTYCICKNDPKNLAGVIALLSGTLSTAGRTLKEKNRSADAMPLFMRAYDYAKGCPELNLQLQIGAARYIGRIFCEQGKYKEALPYLEQAHEMFEKLDETCRQQYQLADDLTASLLGLIYLNDTNGTHDHDYKKAFKFLRQAYRSSENEGHNLKIGAAVNLGYIYRDGLGKKVNLIQARSYFNEAAKFASKAKPFALPIFVWATNGLLITKNLQIEQFDDFYQSLQANPTDDLIKQADALLAEAHETQSMPSDFNTQLEDRITKNQAKLDKLAIQFKQERRKKEKLDRAAKKAASQTQIMSDEALDRKRIEIQALEKVALETAEKKSAAEHKKNLEAMVNKADAEFQTYHRGPSNDRYQRAHTLYNESFPLSKKEPNIRNHIRQQLRILENTYALQLEVSNTSESSDKKEEKQEAQPTPWTILDPNNLAQGKSAAETRLQELATNPLQALQAEKFQALSQACSTRCGSGDRIIYVVLPQHRVGIINIGPHSDYEKVELLRHREDWFLNPTPQAITIAIEQAKKRNDGKQVTALTDFLQQIRTRGSSTDSKEAKEQKS